MFSFTHAARRLNVTFQRISRRKMGSYSPLDADAGALATRVHHTMTMGLVLFTPVLFVVPDSYTDGAFNKTFGVLLSANMATHSWIGMNYVCRDYVPKISYALLGPAKFVNAGLAVITFLGMAKICVMSPGGLKGMIKSLWRAKPKKEIEF